MPRHAKSNDHASNAPSAGGNASPHSSPRRVAWKSIQHRTPLANLSMVFGAAPRIAAVRALWSQSCLSEAVGSVDCSARNALRGPPLPGAGHCAGLGWKRTMAVAEAALGSVHSAASAAGCAPVHQLADQQAESKSDEDVDET